MRHEMYDIAIIGAGPAGLSAAINATIRNKKVIVIEAETPATSLKKAPKIVNYLGTQSISGQEMLDQFLAHAVGMDVEILYVKVEAMSEDEGIYNILAGNDFIQSKTLLLTTGVPYRSTLPREDEMIGRGLGYCATCDGPIYRGKDVLIVGHGPEAEHEASFMAEICSKVYFLPLYKNPGELDIRVEMLPKSKPKNILGGEFVEGLELENGQIVHAEGVFILGAETAPDRLIPGLEIEDNHIKVNRNMETNLPGVYAAGDCIGAPYQIAKAVGEGQIAGLNASKYASRK
ncbi:MAG: NAD(P)/FAD-dependent oxidoreductase [Bacillota bacterium]|nr:NAD(P)/FAD-dependent oxidoreductase [Bacillota bacterium]